METKKIDFNPKNFIKENFEAMSFVTIMLGIIIYFLEKPIPYISQFIILWALILTIITLIAISENLGKYKLNSKLFLFKIGSVFLLFGLLAFFIKKSSPSIDGGRMIIVFSIFVVFVIIYTVIKENRYIFKKKIKIN